MWRALVVSKDSDGTASAALERVDDEQLMPGDVTIDVSHSSINFKDALALTGKPGVVKPDRLIAGIDVVGTVAASDSPDWSVGDRVLVNGCGLSEKHHGGLAERARVNSEWLVPVPERMSPQQAAAVGTAGFTSALAVLALERNGVTGDVLVTGAAGGVGSIAIALLAASGFRAIASTGRLDEEPFLRSLGAADVIDRHQFDEPGKPLQSQRWGGAIDSVGGTPLANVLAQTNYGGTVAACGLAASAKLEMTVMPFILRAVRLEGINSVDAPAALRREAWDRIGRDLNLDLLDSLTDVVALDAAITTAERVLAGEVRGRTVVDVRA